MLLRLGNPDVVSSETHVRGYARRERKMWFASGCLAKLWCQNGEKVSVPKSYSLGRKILKYGVLTENKASANGFFMDHGSQVLTK